MALAKYFSKDLLAINRLISTNQTLLQNKLLSSLITIAFDENAVNTLEGNYGLDLIIRLLSRLYPKLKIVDLSKKNNKKRDELISLANDINSKIEIISDNSSIENIYLVAGYSNKKINSKGTIIYFGSKNWISKYSISKIQRFGRSQNPFGCGMAACIAASNIFRHVFSDYLKNMPLDKEFELSVYSLNMEPNNNPTLNSVKFNDVIIVGIGAIGNGIIWALSNFKDLKGDIKLVDSETVKLSNLQRYVLFKEKDEEKIKVEIANKFFNQKKLKVETLRGKWNDYIKNRNNWDINCVAVSIDNEKDRIGIQSSLPNFIFNSFTEPESIGISRHKNFSIDPCLACSYIPSQRKKDFINEVADNCNIPYKSEMVKDYYNLGKTVNDIWPPKYKDSLLSVIAKSNKIDVSKLIHFNGMKIDQFYSDFVCGGVILELSNTEIEINNVDAPLAFQSAMAGILLASELVKHFMATDLKQEHRTDFYHLAPIEKIYNPYHRIIEKDKTNRCLCRDIDFVNRYNKKWKN